MKTERGFALIELMVAVVVLTIGVMSFRQMYTTNTVMSYTPVNRAEAMLIAKSYLDEITSKPKVDVEEDSGTCEEDAENRALWDDINDYSCLPERHIPQNQGGDELTEFEQYSVTLIIDENANMNGEAATKVTVEVDYPGWVTPVTLSMYRVL